MTSDKGSICFDRAASYYDKTRTVDPDADQKIRALLRNEIGGRDCLEIGVGTGRVALPLHASGVPVVGLDLSEQMLATLVSNAGGSSPIPLVRGDASRLPFRDHSFGAALASWVLHLISAWDSVVTELARAVRPGGVILIAFGARGHGFGSDGESDSDRIRWRFRDEAGVTDWPRGPKSQAELDERMKELGTTPRDLPTVVETRTGTLEQDIRALEEGIFSVTWGVDPETRTNAANATRRWAEETFGSLTEQRSFSHTHEWHAYDVS